MSSLVSYRLALASGAVIFAAALWKNRRRMPLISACVQGVASSTYSTAIVTLGSARIGRDPGVDWMEVGTSYFGKGIIETSPTARAIAAGLFVHQSADFFWAVVFFGPLWPHTRRLSESGILVAGLPWAVVTSAIEYYIALPLIQPWVPMQVPYWTALTVHIVSSLAYPLFPSIRRMTNGRPPTRFGIRWAWFLGATAGVFTSLALLGRTRREPKWQMRGRGPDSPEGRFLRQMTAHHEIGLLLSVLAARHGSTWRLRKLGELMTAEHEAEIELMCHWWRSWFGVDMPGISPDEYRDMTGMPPPALLDRMPGLSGADFDRLFVPVMVHHHEGALIMCQRVFREGRDLRVKLLAESILHSQENQIREMLALLTEATGEPAPAIAYAW